MYTIHKMKWSLISDLKICYIRATEIHWWDIVVTDIQYMMKNLPHSCHRFPLVRHCSHYFCCCDWQMYQRTDACPSPSPNGAYNGAYTFPPKYLCICIYNKSGVSCLVTKTRTWISSWIMHFHTFKTQSAWRPQWNAVAV
jgi:hypothetical protein